MGAVSAALGSSAAFAVGHGQYPPALQVALGVAGLLLAWPFLRARTPWAPWLAHVLGDVLGDTFLTL